MLTPQEAAMLTESSDRSAAEVLPTKLINPVASSVVASPTSPGVTWGVEAVGADVCGLSGKGVKVAVLDTGIDQAHDAFAHLQVQHEEFLGRGSCDDDVGHGTHCAGTIAGGEVNGYRFGVAPGIDLLLSGKVLGRDGGTTDALAKGIIWAREHGANIISMSLGIDFPGHVEKLIDEGIPRLAATSQALVAYTQHLSLFDSLATLAGSPLLSGSPSLLIAAAGNESARSHSPPYTIETAPPAASRHVVAVGALQRQPGGTFYAANFSNIGVALAAPGVDIVSAYPRGRYASLSGTSMAAPHVAAVAALWVQSLNESGAGFTPEMLHARLVGSATHLPGLDRVDVGTGMVQAPGVGTPP